ncbi:hypothetical protein BEH94_00665 [Candidatus Altiarchaeales archaeon WOR_SM1_SCG]|nr:hypothetical protein BEH94_00665 [Candidatus Altiarchaeales archaeon WOR_SM1_SCG]
MEKKEIGRIKATKTLDESEFKYPDDLNELREEIIKNLNACENIIDINTVLEEYYGEIMGRMAVGEI